MISLTDFIKDSDTFFRLTHDVPTDPSELKKQMSEMRNRLMPIEQSFIACMKKCGPVLPQLDHRIELAFSLSCVASIERYLNNMEKQ